MQDDKQNPTMINRELSWMAFNERVLEEAMDEANPILERAKFMAIVSSNLDEFFMIRVASIGDRVLAGVDEPDASGMTSTQQLEAIHSRAADLVREINNGYLKQLLPELERNQLYFEKMLSLGEALRQEVIAQFHREVFPVLTPMVVDSSRPFPLLLNKSLNIAVLLEVPDEEEPLFATVQVPAVLDRLIPLPGHRQHFVLLEDVIKHMLPALFAGRRILTAGCYRITRNADQGLDEEGAEDLLEAIEQFVKMRKWGAVIRLEVEQGFDPRLLQYLQEELEVPESAVFACEAPLDLTFLSSLPAPLGISNTRFPSFVPKVPPVWRDAEDPFSAIRGGDILLHHPYEAFDPVVELVSRAADDPQVLAIKQTLYRVSGKSPIVEALARAAENGKQVTVLLELKARFDEQNNILWAKRLEQAGCHVIYGLVGLKTHCKLLLVVRREEEGIRRYVHVGTGNYNDVTARFYTDLSLMTDDMHLGADASAVFNMLSGFSMPTSLYKMAVAPLDLRDRIQTLIHQEIRNVRRGGKGQIILKINSLVDTGMISALYEASQAGVKIDLIVRGICALRPGVPGMSEHIRVRSIVGRFLEHSRIYYFHADGEELCYLASADLMERNLDRRVELLVPVEAPGLKKRIRDILEVCLEDNTRARRMMADGRYRRSKKKEKKTDSQKVFLEMVREVQETEVLPVFRPGKAPEA